MFPEFFEHQNSFTPFLLREKAQILVAPMRSPGHVDQGVRLAIAIHVTPSWTGWVHGPNPQGTDEKISSLVVEFMLNLIPREFCMPLKMSTFLAEL